MVPPLFVSSILRQLFFRFTEEVKRRKATYPSWPAEQGSPSGG